MGIPELPAADLANAPFNRSPTGDWVIALDQAQVVRMPLH
jgi:hypothetical protein